jgi:formylglycine-generating enzyme required for sulfatase activity
MSAVALTPEIIVIPEGTFLMGSDAGADNERPVHRVQVVALAWSHGYNEPPL